MSIYLNKYTLSKNTILNLGYLRGLAPPLCVLRTPPVLLRPKGVPAVLAQRSYILDKLGYASRKTALLVKI